MARDVTSTRFRPARCFHCDRPSAFLFHAGFSMLITASFRHCFTASRITFSLEQCLDPAAPSRAQSDSDRAHSLQKQHMMNGPGSPMPFIKNEPDDFSFDPNRFARSINGSNFQQQNGQSYAPWQGSSIDPLDVSMNGTSMPQSFGQNISSSLHVGNSQITDDDLLGSLDTTGGSNANEMQMSHANGMQNQGMHQGQTFGHNFQRSMQPPTSNPHQMNGYSSTPDGAPIQSPFDQGNFDYIHWQAANNGSAAAPNMARSASGSGLQPHERHVSLSRSPMTPMTPGMGNLHIGSSENGGSYPGQPIPGHKGHQGHHHSISSTWDNSLGSAYSQFDGPLTSPGSAMHPQQISEVLKSGTPTSHHTPPKGTSKTTAEMKKAKRRASHNEVERRRRNHINAQITALAKRVPSHRLEDDNLRRSLNSGPLPPSLAANSASPPQATSLLAGGVGRRAAGSISTGIPIDEKDKGPAKGDVLNASVGWMHDLLWMLNKMIDREKQLVESGGQVAPVGEEEARMLSELKGAFERNRVPEIMYTRAHGSSLFVPGYTDQAGAPLPPGSRSSISPTSFSLDMGPPSNGHNGDHNQFWGYPNEGNGLRASTELKEEEDFDFDMTT